MDSYRVSKVDVPESPVVSGTRGPWQQQRCDSLQCHEEWWGSVPPSIVVFSWALDGSGAAGTWSGRQCLLSALEFSVVQNCPLNVISHTEQHLHSILCRVHFLCTRRTEMLPFIWLARRFKFDSYEWAQQRFVQESHLPFGSGPTRPVRLHSDAIVAPRKFHGVSNALQVCSNSKCRAECGVKFCVILRFPLIIYAQSIGISIQQGSKELNFVVLHVGSSCTVVVLNGILTFPNALTHRATVRYGNAASLHASRNPENILVYYACHFNFDPGTLL